MNLNKFKIVYWLPTLSFWLSFQLLNWQANWIWGVLLFLFLINFLNLKFLPGIKDLSWSKYLIASVPAIFSVGAIVYTSLLTNYTFIQLLIFLAALIIYQYWRLSYKKFSPKLIKNKILHLFAGDLSEIVFTGVSLYVNFLAMFLVASSLLGLKYFLNLDYWLIFTFLAIFVFLLTLAAARASNLLNNLDQKYFWFSVALVIWQFGIILFFLPLSYSVSGFLLAIAFYAVINLGRFSLSGKLTANRLKWYAIFPLISIVILLLTANWT
jgi:hypothetical protein